MKVKYGLGEGRKGRKWKKGDYRDINGRTSYRIPQFCRDDEEVDSPSMVTTMFEFEKDSLPARKKVIRELRTKAKNMLSAQLAKTSTIDG